MQNDYRDNFLWSNIKSTSKEKSDYSKKMAEWYFLGKFESSVEAIRFLNENGHMKDKGK